LPGSGSLLAAALAVELVDELADGTKSAALPLIKHGLSLSYGQVGLLAAVPLIAGSLLELPFGVVAGQGRRRVRLMLAGGLVFAAALAGTAAARSFAVLLAAFVLFYPASGAFAGLAQSSLMDASPDRQVPNMARWNLAGSAGAVCGPLLLAAVLAGGGSWRAGYLLLAGLSAAAWLAMWRAARPPGWPGQPGQAAPDGPASGERAGRDTGPAAPAAASWRAALGGLRRHPRAVRWVLLAEVANLLLDVLTGFTGLYFTAVVHATAAQAALAVAVRLGAGLAGDALLVAVSERASPQAILRGCAAAAMPLYPVFLLVPGLAAKLAVLAVLSLVTAPWYPLLQAALYESLPGDSGLAVSLSSAAALAGGLGPLAVGFAAGQAGLGRALAALAVVPAVLLAALPRRDRGARRGKPGE
jgi:MFS transporter, FSR family, fosmidomycin resistance protein